MPLYLAKEDEFTVVSSFTLGYRQILLILTLKVKAIIRCRIQENKKNVFIGDFEFFLGNLEIGVIALNKYRKLNYIIS